MLGDGPGVAEVRTSGSKREVWLAQDRPRSERQGDEPGKVGGLNSPGMCSGEEGLVVEHFLFRGWCRGGPGTQDGLLGVLDLEFRMAC